MKIFTLAVIVLSAHVAVSQQGPARTATPDLEGVWNFATLTPLERPAQLGDKEFLTDAEAAASSATRWSATTAIGVTAGRKSTWHVQ